MIRFLAACLALAALFPIPSHGQHETSLDAGTVIDNIISGIDYTGQEIIVSGIVFSTTSTAPKRVNVGSRQAYDSGKYKHYIAVYDADVNVAEGTPVTFKIHIEKSIGGKVGERTFVMIEGRLLECLSCKK